MASKGLRRALSKFRARDSRITPSHVTRGEQSNEPKRQCLQLNPAIHDYPNIKIRCCLKEGHEGYHYDGKYGVQWDEHSIAWNQEFLKHSVE